MNSLANHPPVHILPDSLGDTLDLVNSELFYDHPLAQETGLEVALWIANRQGLPRSYTGMFAPTAYDYSVGMLTFTGEAVVSNAGTAHVLSEEACRALYRLGAADHPEVHGALRRARQAIFRRLEGGGGNGLWSGVYCCGMCSVAMWRHFAASHQPEDERRLENGLIELKRHRDGKGRWKQYPFYYTLLALLEINLPAVRLEVEYALPAIERALRRVEKSDPGAETEHERRRRIVMGRLLNKL